MQYKNIIILGTSRLAAVCGKEIKDKIYEVIIIDTNKVPNKILEMTCEKMGLLYCFFNEREREKFIINKKGNTLLFSITNPWIIPKMILKKKGLKAINFHHSLLPRHPGRNAEAWAIFEGDPQAGITWHYITPNIDMGDIIIQRGIKLNQDITSLKLLRIQDRLAEEAFKTVVDNILGDKACSVPQDIRLRSKMHYSWEAPNDGYLDPNWESNIVSRYLRAMDYGPLEVLGKPRIIVSDKEYTWKTYSISDTDKKGDMNITIIDDYIILDREQMQFKLYNIERIG